MRIYSMKIDRYLYLCELVEQLLKQDVFNTFKEDDIFFITDGKNEKAFSVLKSENGNPFGISFFMGNEGLNTAHDIFCVSNLLSFTPLSYYLTNVILVSKKDLLPKEIDFLKKNNIKIKKNNNVILKTFVPGLEPHIASNKDADNVIESILCLLLLLKNDLDILKRGFDEKLSAVMKVNYNKHVYSLNMQSLPYLERKYDNKSFLEEELHEFDNLEYHDNEASIIFRHVEVPVKIRGTNVNIYPLFIFYFLDGQMKECEILASSPREYRSGIINISKEYFTKYGIPKNMIINNRNLYAELYNLYDALNIELELLIENELIDELINNICHSTSQMAYGSPFFNENIGAILEEDAIGFFEFIKNTINFSASHTLEELLDSAEFEDMEDEEFDVELDDENKEGYIS